MRETLRDLLECRLELAAERGRFGRPQRIAWLAEYLAEFVSRATAFLSIAPMGARELHGSQSFAIVDVAQQLLDGEIRGARVDREVADAWKEFRWRWRELVAGAAEPEPARASFQRRATSALRRLTGRTQGHPDLTVPGADHERGERLQAAADRLDALLKPHRPYRPPLEMQLGEWERST
ncbi:hypothetical protein [Longimicrobium terrae]|uniref:Uncharacterized protein n=1 Tax=Longimicrobium terrae TaxID=1639882 RepID=A0A841H2J7_9BACT|nr:hypothetical protein [Longimicrobium terrae]MBB4637966.1 hypothetical protein [Longimicrobium terrae]MBB6072213.1 hypothetical protein [Longimicrobium terrae]NNC28361.1 hypothetical protein [Longimicrobium terrae]